MVDAESVTKDGTAAVEDILEFVRVQARPDLVFSHQGGRGAAAGAADPTPIRSVSSSPVPLDRGLSALLADTPYPEVAADSAKQPRSRRLQCLLQQAAGFQRYEPGNAFNTHRAFPSAQCKFPSEVFLSVGEGTWYFDAARHELRPVGNGAAAPDLWAAVDAGAPAVVIVLGRPGSLPGYYRELRWSLTLCEGGHLLGLTAQLARTLGFDAHVLTDFDDQALLQRAGAEPGDQWLPVGLVALDGADAALTRTDPEWPVDQDPVLRMDRHAWQEDAGPDAGTAGGLHPAVRPAPHRVVASSRSWGDVLFERSSGRAPGGFTASPELLPSTAVPELLDAISDAAAMDWGGLLGGAEPGILLHLAVERAAGIDDGIYAYDAMTGKLTQQQHGARLAEVQQSFFYPQQVTRVDSCNVAIFGSINYAGILASHGPRALRLAQIQLGALMQAGALACAASGLFLRPCRSFSPDGLGALIGLGDQETVSYLCLAGKSRFADLLLDQRI
ncbi:hypothetical protein ABZ904_26110 [Streptomyces sp. NPDC046900]|uniref:hypothetical protein n=1 Tax=Streptomyces sp. NPDC046900 TaxID=3155473 RepID=UPI0033E6454D